MFGCGNAKAGQLRYTSYMQTVNNLTVTFSPDEVKAILETWIKENHGKQWSEDNKCNLEDVNIDVRLNVGIETDSASLMGPPIDRPVFRNATVKISQ